MSLLVTTTPTKSHSHKSRLIFAIFFCNAISTCEVRKSKVHTKYFSIMVFWHVICIVSSILTKHFLSSSFTPWPNAKSVTGIGGYTRWGLFSMSLCILQEEMAFPVPTKGFSWSGPDTAVLFNPSGAPTHLPLSHPLGPCKRISIGQCWRWHHEAESLTMHIYIYHVLVKG